MREILFKAKRIPDGEWTDEGTYVRVNGKEYIVPWYASVMYGFEVDPATVCQYTGLTDKNGKKIFEGDKLVVCLYPETKNGIVKYNTDSASFWMDFSDCFSTFLDFEIAKRKVGEKVWIQITGNIHDNT